MALFRRTRKGRDLLGDIIKFKEEYLKRDKSVELGWNEVPLVDGSGINSWHQLRTKLVGEGSTEDKNGWPKLQLESRKEEMVGLMGDF